MQIYTILIACFSINDTENMISLITKNALPLAITAAGTDEEALARILDAAGCSPFDILLTDIGMPSPEGLNLSRRVRILSPHTKIILYSSFHNPELLREATCIGVQDYLTAPICPKEISAAIRQVLSSLAESPAKEQIRNRQNHIVKSHLLWLALHDKNISWKGEGFLGNYYHMLMLENKNEFFNGQNAIFWQNIEKLPLADLISFSNHLEEIFDMQKRKQTNSAIYMKHCFLELVKVMLKAGCAKTDTDALTDRIYHSDGLPELLQIIRKLAASAVNAPSEAAADSLKVDKIRQFICLHYDEPLSLNDIAAHFYISPNYLCAVFKKETGGNVMRFLNDYRLARARELLLSTQMKIHLVAEAVGFRNTSYFCQKFRDAYRETPESFRQKAAFASPDTIKS